jgi:hypothetical protein
LRQAGHRSVIISAKRSNAHQFAVATASQL